MNENIIDLWSNNIFTLKDGFMNGIYSINM